MGKMKIQFSDPLLVRSFNVHGSPDQQSGLGVIQTDASAGHGDALAATGWRETWPIFASHYA